jgi:hypothetical protein
MHHVLVATITPCSSSVLSSNEFITLEKQHAYLLARNVWIDAMGAV